MLDELRTGKGQALALRGQAGIGKTALLEHLVDAASGFTVARAAGVESEMELPFAALHQLCAPMLHHIDELSEPQRDAANTAFGLTVGAFPNGLLIGLAVLNLLSAVADDRPLLCVVDDAQWLDRESAQALTFVGRRLLADPIGLVFATREPELDLGGCPELVLDRLEDADARVLLDAVLHVRLDERVRDRIVAETHGNPLAIVEWTKGLTPAELAGGFGMPAHQEMMGQLEERFRRRFLDLPPPSQHFLTVAAAEPTGDPVIVWRAASGLGVDPRDAAPAVDAGLVELGVRLSFRHPLVRSAVYGATPLEDRQEVHRHLAEATDPERDPDRRAWHQALGSPGPDDEIAESLAGSARRARARGGFAAAAALLERSAALSLDRRQRGKRLLSAASASLDAGSFDDAATLLAAAEAAPLDDRGRARLDLLRARHAAIGGDMRDAPGLSMRAAERLIPVDEALARHTYVAGISSAVTAGVFATDVTMRDIALAARECPVPDEKTRNDWLLVGLAELSLQGPAAAAPALKRVVEPGDDDPSLFEAFQWSGFQIAAASILWDIEALDRFATRLVGVTREIGALTLLPSGLHSQAQANLLQGDLGTAGTLVAESVEIVQATGSKLLPWPAPSIVALGGRAGAASAIDALAAEARAARHGFLLNASHWARATLANAEGRYDEALAAATEGFQGRIEWFSHLWFHELVEAGARAGRPEDLDEVLGHLTESTEASGTDWALGVLARCRALLASGATAEPLYAEAVDRLGRTTIRPELARAHLLYGEWLRRENRRVDARAQLTMAFDLFDAMEMDAFAERTRHELLATGATVRKRNAGTLAELTPQEAHITRLAADGQTNPEIGAQLFISPRTVEWHLRKVFTKLDVSSRKELSEALSGRPT